MHPESMEANGLRDLQKHFSSDVTRSPEPGKGQRSKSWEEGEQD